LTPAEVTAELRARLGHGIHETVTFRDETTTYVDPDAIVETLTVLRDHLKFDHLSDVTAVDWLGRTPRFDVVYHLFSYETHLWYRVKVKVDEDRAVPTVTGVFEAANWSEREIYDLFGITFEGHPDLTRILMPLGWVGYPLRKDYPMSQITLPRAGATKIPE